MEKYYIEYYLHNSPHRWASTVAAEDAETAIQIIKDKLNIKSIASVSLEVCRPNKNLEEEAMRLTEDIGASYVADIEESLEAIHYDPDGVSIYDILQLKEVRGLLNQAQGKLLQIKMNIERANQQPEERRNENERI